MDGWSVTKLYTVLGADSWFLSRAWDGIAKAFDPDMTLEARLERRARDFAATRAGARPSRLKRKPPAPLQLTRGHGQRTFTGAPALAYQHSCPPMLAVHAKGLVH